MHCFMHWFRLLRPHAGRKEVEKTPEITFFVKKKYQFFWHISSSYDKILGETKFQTREFSQSGSKAEDIELEFSAQLRRALILCSADGFVF